MLQMMLQCGGAGIPNYADDVFSAYTYTGTSSSQTITTGLDLSGNGGLVWIKSRSAATDHKLTDTARGVQNALISNSTAAQTTDTTGLTAFGSTGFTIGANATYNNSGATYVAWSFRKAAKFFDVVTFTTDGSGNATVPHSLTVAPGMVITKPVSSGGSSWISWNRGLTSTNYYVLLNSTAAEANFGSAWINPGATSVVFQNGVFVPSTQYVAYLFAHDSAADGLIQCGTYTESAPPLLINLGWEAQYVLVKRYNTTGVWRIFDSYRGFMAGGPVTQPQLLAEAADAEGTSGSVSPVASGFVANGGSSDKFMYVAIRRPNKPPTLGTQVYSAGARSGTGAVATISGVGFAPDVQWTDPRNALGNNVLVDRLRGPSTVVKSNNNNAETTETDTVTSFTMGGSTLGNGATSGNVNFSTGIYIDWFFKRAPGVFDEVCYTGTGANTTQAHNLQAVPELMLVKQRSGIQLWSCYASGLANTEYLVLSGTDAKASGATYWNSTTPTSSVFSVGTAAATNANTQTYVAYLFATKAGISKVGSYTGNGSSQTINCGFTTGARFVVIKRTDSAGDWYVWDTIRGITAGNDPHLSLNTTVAEVTTDDSVDADTSGFIVNQLAATNVNVAAATYIFLAFA